MANGLIKISRKLNLKLEATFIIIFLLNLFYFCLVDKGGNLLKYLVYPVLLKRKENLLSSPQKDVNKGRVRNTKKKKKKKPNQPKS